WFADSYARRRPNPRRQQRDQAGLVGRVGHVSPVSRGRRKKRQPSRSGGRPRPRAGFDGGRRSPPALASRPRLEEVFRTAIADAAAVTRKASPLQTELWASLVTSAWLPEPPDTEPLLSVDDDLPGFIARAVARGDAAAHVMLAALAAGGAPEEVAAQAARGAEQLAAGAALPEWASWLGRVRCDGAWYGPADLYGDQDMGVLSFRYDNAAEPHVVAMLTDNLNGGLAVHAFTDDPVFLDK